MFGSISAFKNRTTLNCAPRNSYSKRSELNIDRKQQSKAEIRHLISLYLKKGGIHIPTLEVITRSDFSGGIPMPSTLGA